MRGNGREELLEVDWLGMEEGREIDERTREGIQVDS